MIILDRDRLARADEACQKLNPKLRVRMIRPGFYRVESESNRKPKNQGNEEWYQVHCGLTPDGDRYVACSCYAGTRDRVCKHCIPGVIYHIFVMGLIKQDRTRFMAESPDPHQWLWNEQVNITYIQDWRGKQTSSKCPHDCKNGHLSHCDIYEEETVPENPEYGCQGCCPTHGVKNARCN